VQRNRREKQVSNNDVRKKKRAGETMPMVKCFCGAKILLVPDVKKMSEAIEAHAKEHAKNYKTEKEKDIEADRVREDLIAKVLAKACEA